MTEYDDEVRHLGRLRLAWMHANELPLKYTETHCRPHYLAAMPGGGPVILRGSRETMYRTPDQRAMYAARFINKAARLLRVTTAEAPRNSARTEMAKLDRIEAAAYERWPMCRSIAGLLRDPNFHWVDGRRVLIEQAPEESMDTWELLTRDRCVRSIARVMREIQALTN